MSKSLEKKKEKIKDAVSLLKQLSHPVRLSILCNLIQKGEMTVGEIVAAEDGNAGQSQISQFLNKMRSANLVTCRKEAQTVYYQVHSLHAKKIIEAIYQIYCGEEA